MKKIGLTYLFLVSLLLFSLSFISAVVISTAIIVDNTDSGFSSSGNWTEANNSCGYNSNYVYETDSEINNTARWTPVISSSTNYSVYVSYCIHSARPSAVPYTIVYSTGNSTINIDQTKDSLGNSVADFTNSGWLRLGAWRFTTSGGQYVELDSSSAGDTCADAVKFIDAFTSPILLFKSPTDSNSVVLGRDYIIFNVTATDDDLASITVNLYDSTRTLVDSKSSASSFSDSFTGLSDGVYYMNATATDVEGNMDNTETRTIILDLIAPNIIEGVADPSCTYNYSSIKLNATFNDTRLNQIWVGGNWEGSWRNYSVTCSNIDSESKTCRYTVSSVFLQDGEIFNWIFYANDSVGNLASGSMQTLALKPRTVLTVLPSTPNGLLGWYISEPLFTLTNSNASNLFYRWDGDGTFVYSGAFNLINSPNNANITGGLQELNYWSNSSCGVEEEQTVIFHMDFSNPILENLSPVNGVNLTCTSNPIISAVISDIYGTNSLVDKGSVVMTLDEVIVPTSITDVNNIKVKVSYTPTNLSQGSHIVRISGNDNAGRVFNQSWSFAMGSSSSLNLNVSLPKNSTYASKRVRFAIATFNFVSKLEYKDSLGDDKWKTLCKNCKDYNKELYFSEGDHDVTIRATDSCGNSKEYNSYFLIDSVAPRINKISPRRNEFVNGSLFHVKYSEDDCKNITLNYGNSVLGYRKEVLNNCLSGKNQEWNASVNLTSYNGQAINFWFNISDAAQIKGSRITSVNVDTSIPILKVNSPRDLNYSRNVLFDLNVGEKVKIEYMDLNNLRPRWTNLQSNTASFNKTRRFSEGDHSVIIKATDKAGNSDSETINFEVII